MKGGLCAEFTPADTSNHCALRLARNDRGLFQSMRAKWLRRSPHWISSECMRRILRSKSDAHVRFAGSGCRGEITVHSRERV